MARKGAELWFAGCRIAHDKDRRDQHLSDASLSIRLLMAAFDTDPRLAASRSQDIPGPFLLPV